MKYIYLFLSMGMLIVSLFFVEWVKLDANNDVKTVLGLALSSVLYLHYKILDIEEKPKGVES